MPADKPLSFQGLILKLHDYWSRQGAVILQPHDVEVGAGTLHPATVLRALGLKQSAFAFAHGAEHTLPRDLALVDSYHCSRYNTNTRRLTTRMFRTVVGRATQLARGLSDYPPTPNP